MKSIVSKPTTHQATQTAISPAIALYRSTVMHQRYFPQRYRFYYQVFSFLIDIDQVKNKPSTALISYNRFNLFSIYQRDHGARDGTGWRIWVNQQLKQKGLNRATYRIKLLCFPRILGYAFNPLSLWYCYGKDDNLYAIIAEVRNTFGEHHHYILHNDNQPYTDKVRAHKNKCFHVSPFISMDAEYRFVMDSPDDTLTIVINEYQQQQLMLTATQNGQQVAMTSTNLLHQFFRVPFMTLKIMLMIHWQAAKIWWRGGTFYKKPPTSES